MKHYVQTILLLSLIAFVSLTSCSELKESDTEPTEAMEMTGILSSMTRATETVQELKDYVGKEEFADNDSAVFTTIKRSIAPLPQFTYSNLKFVCAAQKGTDGKVSIGWSRDKNTGTTGTGSPEAHPDRIYWSDAISNHTFIGYCAPQQGGGKAFDWKKRTVNGLDTYYGSIGDPTVLPTSDAPGHDIDFRSTYDSEGQETLSGNVELCKNDILLTHSTTITADDAIANLKFYHGLAQVRVIVNISDFAAGGGNDTKSVVSDMVLKNMLMMYKWEQTSVATEELVSTDQSELDALYSPSTVNYNQRKDVKLWIPEPAGVGDRSAKTFTFYGLAVPTQIPTQITPPASPLPFSFNVTYPDPMDPNNKTITKPYNASISGIHFDAGKCTTINISLNHKNEKMTVAAMYQDWDYVENPDQGNLKKNSTFLDTDKRDDITIFGDPKADIDDATWLYVDPTTLKVLDVYGNDGSEAHPFVISTALQLLSFAYEVKGGTNTKPRPAVTYKDLSGNSQSLAAGASFDFDNYYVKLDADITMQSTAKMQRDNEGFYTLDDDTRKDATATGVIWPGIGEDSKPFKGVFNGGYRHINKLYGASFFNHIGPDAIVDHIYITEALGIRGSGSIAEKNEGVICGSYVEGDIVGEKETKYSGSIVGINTGVLIACSHIGNIECSSDTLGALLGRNDGILVTCYNVGDAKNNKSGKPALAGVGNFTPRSVAYSCYYNGDFYTSHDYNLTAAGVIGHVAFPLTTAEMQSNKYVNEPRVENKDSGGNIISLTGEITDAGTKTYATYDPFYYHWSMNTGLKRAVEFINEALNKAKAGDEYVIFHAPGTSDNDPNISRIKLKKSLVEWLVKHFATVETVDGKFVIQKFTHEFQFIPGTYPKLK